MLAITSPNGKLGSAIISSLLEHSLIPPTQLVLLTTSPSSPNLLTYHSLGIHIRPFSYHNPSLTSLASVTKLFLISTPEITLDYNNAVPGRERVHISVFRAAIEAGVQHLYYCSLAFGDESGAGVMRAHLRTEAWLFTLPDEKPEVKVTVLREGIYNENWWYYLGYYKPKDDDREEVVVAGDGKICWTSIADDGLATAMILTAPSEEYDRKTLYLSTPSSAALTLTEVAAMVGKARGKELKLKFVSKEDYERHYVEERGKPKENVNWWSGTYAALEKGEASVDDPTLLKLLSQKGVKPKSMEETVKEMVATLE